MGEVSIEKIVSEIKRLKKEKNAVILAHYYSRPEIQDISDFLGDSLGLSQEAGRTDAKIILFCGVNFMAETASIISPDKKVIVPDNRAGCSLAESITGEDICKWRKQNPGGVVVSYINTTAEVKAHSDICCTSANAIEVVESIPRSKKIFFVPDKNLGAYINLKSGRNMELWNGDCCVHEQFDSASILEMIEKYPQADILIHPESNCSGDPEILALPQTYYYSTSGMFKHLKSSTKKQFVIMTEKEIIHQMQKEHPHKEFIPAGNHAICGQMKKNTLEKVLLALQNESPEIRIPDEIRDRAWFPIKKMLEVK
ncbi:MAG: hypothetical protein ACD_77C00461G0001 [uncultured bacterium]|nr:MAG: hypothetical protein ACD_77C00461G0001 [uncultured bacterium]HBY01329.1 quinolinate synthase [Rikenellaceae bacterium]